MANISKQVCILDTVKIISVKQDAECCGIHLILENDMTRPKTFMVHVKSFTCRGRQYLYKEKIEFYLIAYFCVEFALKAVNFFKKLNLFLYRG